MRSDAHIRKFQTNPIQCRQESCLYEHNLPPACHQYRVTVRSSKISQQASLIRCRRQLTDARTLFLKQSTVLRLHVLWHSSCRTRRSNSVCVKCDFHHYTIFCISFLQRLYEIKSLSFFLVHVSSVTKRTIARICHRLSRRGIYNYGQRDSCEQVEVSEWPRQACKFDLTVQQSISEIPVAFLSYTVCLKASQVLNFIVVYNIIAMFVSAQLKINLNVTIYHVDKIHDCLPHECTYDALKNGALVRVGYHLRMSVIVDRRKNDN
mmetsp:Transcript_64167/g.93938  ORF Transcript_64167/g.93938 Transcript_64167/m.93938 type:complete len:264 (-) Transcript_64167:3543-4334(-)